MSSEELQTHFYGVSSNRAIEYLLQRSCPDEELPAYSEKKEAYYRDFCREDQSKFHLVRGASAFFSKQQEQGIPFAITSASIKTNIEFFVEFFGLRQWFDHKRFIYDDGRFADKVEMFRLASRVIGVPVKACLIFEDSESGIRDALKEGCRNVIVVDSVGVADRYVGQPGIVKVIKTFEEMN